MRRLAATFLALSIALPAAAQSKSKEPLVEFENMTWPEVKQALADGKTTALFYTGGVEQRGPQNINGGHNYMARATVKAIALALGDAIAMPVLPFTPNNASATLPGTIGITTEILQMTLERIAEQAIATGFKNVVLMGDHGGGQPNVYREVAKKLDDKYSAQGIHVIYCDDVYGKRQEIFLKQLKDEGYPDGFHGALIDTSLMMYVCLEVCVRQDMLKEAVGDPMVPRGTSVDPNVKRKNNGIQGDGRRSSAALGKREMDLAVDLAVKQIHSLLPAK